MKKNIDFTIFDDDPFKKNSKNVRQRIRVKNEVKQRIKSPSAKNLLLTSTDIWGGLFPLSGIGLLNASLAGGFNTPQTPAGAYVSDIKNTQINRAARKITKNNSLTVIKPKVITNLPEDQIEALRYHMNSIPNRKEKGVWTAEDYKRIKEDYAAGDAIFLNNLAPHKMIESTLGQYSYYTDEFGNIIITDVYDYNSSSKPNATGFMKKLRDFGGKFGSFRTEPNEGKFHYRINIGNPRFFWKRIRKDTKVENLIEER